MQQFHGRPTDRERKPETTRVSASMSYQPQQDRRSNGDPSKFNTRSERRRIGWENDLYERQSIWWVPGKQKALYDLSVEGSKRENEEATRIARELESDDANENIPLGNVASPGGEDGAENRVSTSLRKD